MSGVSPGFLHHLTKKMGMVDNQAGPVVVPRIGLAAADAMEEFNERQQVLLSKMKQKLQQLAKGKA